MVFLFQENFLFWNNFGSMGKLPRQHRVPAYPSPRSSTVTVWHCQVPPIRTGVGTWPLTGFEVVFTASSTDVLFRPRIRPRPPRCISWQASAAPSGLRQLLSALAVCDLGSLGSLPCPVARPPLGVRLTLFSWLDSRFHVLSGKCEPAGPEQLTALSRTPSLKEEFWKIGSLAK